MGETIRVRRAMAGGSAPRGLTHRCTCHAAVRWTGAEAPMLCSARRRHGSCRSLLPMQLLGAATAAPRRFVVCQAGVQVNGGSVRRPQARDLVNSRKRSRRARERDVSQSGTNRQISRLRNTVDRLAIEVASQRGASVPNRLKTGSWLEEPRRDPGLSESRSSGSSS
jgi:hypothetical protein